MRTSAAGAHPTASGRLALNSSVGAASIAAAAPASTQPSTVWGRDFRGAFSRANASPTGLRVRLRPVRVAAQRAAHPIGHERTRRAPARLGALLAYCLGAQRSAYLSRPHADVANDRRGRSRVAERELGAMDAVLGADGGGAHGGAHVAARPQHKALYRVCHRRCLETAADGARESRTLRRRRRKS